MRILIIDHYYDSFVDEHYTSQPKLAQAPFDEQIRSLASELFGETKFQVDALRELGHEALFWPVNVPAVTRAWAQEHGVKLPRSRSVGFSRRAGVPVPYWTEDPRWQLAALQAVATWYDPEAVHIQCIHLLPVASVKALRANGRVVSAQSAAPVLAEDLLPSYDVFVSSIPPYVARARAIGVEARYLPLAFEPTLASDLPIQERDVPLSFIGGIPSTHSRRQELLADIADRLPIAIWSPQPPAGRLASSPNVEYLGPAWGRQMYAALQRSEITLNIHGEHAGGYANNLRLFEATGMGAMLVTDGLSNIGELFEPGKEVVTFDDAESLLRAVVRFSSSPTDARRIAQRGLERTQRDHSWIRRMDELVTIMTETRTRRA